MRAGCAPRFDISWEIPAREDRFQGPPNKATRVFTKKLAQQLSNNYALALMVEQRCAASRSSAASPCPPPRLEVLLRCEVMHGVCYCCCCSRVSCLLTLRLAFDLTFSLAFGRTLIMGAFVTLVLITKNIRTVSTGIITAVIRETTVPKVLVLVILHGCRAWISPRWLLRGRMLRRRIGIMGVPTFGS